MSYPGHSLGVTYLSAEMQSLYSTVSSNWARFYFFIFYILIFTMNNEYGDSDIQ